MGALTSGTARGWGPMLAEHLRGEAWPGDKTDKYDNQNRRSALALVNLAENVEQLPDDEPRLARLAACHYFERGRCSPGEHGQRVVRRWCFHSPTGSPDEFLTDLVAAAERDAAEWAEMTGDEAD